MLHAIYMIMYLIAYLEWVILNHSSAEFCFFIPELYAAFYSTMLYLAVYVLYHSYIVSYCIIVVSYCICIVFLRHCVVFCCIVLYCTISFAICCILLHGTMLSFILLYFIVFHSKVFYWSVLYWIGLLPYCCYWILFSCLMFCSITNVLHYIVLNSITCSQLSFSDSSSKSDVICWWYAQVGQCSRVLHHGK